MRCELDFPDVHGRLRLHLAEPVAVLTARSLAEVPRVIAEAERRARAGEWVAGFVSYEAAPAFDPALHTRPAAGPLPLACFAAYADASTALPPAESEGFDCGPWAAGSTPAEIDRHIARIQAGIAAGDYYQVNLTDRLRAAFSGNPRALHAALRAAQPEAYCACLDGGDWQILSASPELFFDWPPGGRLVTRPMKGTAPRHADPAADADAARSLCASAKERAENLMIVDLLRNDLSRIAVTGSVRVPELFAVEALPTAWQMTSRIECTPRQGVGLTDVFRALFPCGSVTGAPKVAAMRAIATLETTPRGAYCGAIGVIRPGGHATFNVGIRGVTLDAATGGAECGIGSGITSDATAAGEQAEWLVKRRFLLRAAANFELLETLPLTEGDLPEAGRHLDRMAASAEHFGFAFDRAATHGALTALATVHPHGRWRVRLCVDRQGAVRSECLALDAAPGCVSVALAASAVDSSDEFLRHKTTRRAAYDAHAPAPGIFDTLLWNERGELTEFTRGNVVAEFDGRRLTPPAVCGLLPGVLRGMLLESGDIEEGVLRKEDLPRATRLWFVNHLRGMIEARVASTDQGGWDNV